MIRLHHCEQRSADWYRLRSTRVTGSGADALYAKGKSGGESAARRDLRVSIALALEAGVVLDDGDGFQSADMRRGIEHESGAAAAYEAHSGHLLDRAGFVERLDVAAGCSPDGLVMTGAERIRGVVEIKCPKPAIHIEYVRAGRVPPDYVPQVIHALWVTGAEWADFVSFQPQLPDDLRLFVCRARPHEFDFDDHRARVERLLAEARVTADEIRALRRAA